MESPAISRSPSAIFMPGPHRRSHPNLQDLSRITLTPLTTTNTSTQVPSHRAFDDVPELSASASLSQIATLPAPAGILTNSPARSRASSRKRKIKSSVRIQLDSEDVSAPQSNKVLPKRSQRAPNLTMSGLDADWLVQTGLSLSEGFRESKGQSWLAKRDSSTSLATTPMVLNDSTRDFPFARAAVSATALDKSGSRGPSRNNSTSRFSKSALTMTAASFVTAAEYDQIPDQIFEEVEPSWADEQSQAEAALLRWEMLLQNENDEDPYAALDFTQQGDSSDDEFDIGRLIAARRIPGLNWFDEAADAMLIMEDQVELQPEHEKAVHHTRTRLLDSEVEAPPSDLASYWQTARWFAGVLKRAAAG